MYSPSPPVRPRSGFGGATTVTSSPSSWSWRPRKPDASANAPWTRTMVGPATSNHLTPIEYTVNAHLVTWPAPVTLCTRTAVYVAELCVRAMRQGFAIPLVERDHVALAARRVRAGHIGRRFDPTLVPLAQGPVLL